MHHNVLIYLAVALGSGLGSLSRYLCSFMLFNLWHASFLWATLLVNIIGSWLIGFYAAFALEPKSGWALHPAIHQFVLAGFCGGFTTFSIFSLESLLLWQQGHAMLAALYVFVSLLFWMLSVWIGYSMGARCRVIISLQNNDHAA